MSKLQIASNLELPLETLTQTLVVYGGKGMGKSNFGTVLVEEFARVGLRFSVIDPLGVFWGLRHSADGKSLGVEVLMLGGARGDIPIEPTGGAVVADLVADEDVNVVIDISRKASGQMWGANERIRFMADYCSRLFERQGERRRPIMQIVDEAGRFVPQTIPSGAIDLARCVGAIEQLVEWGRNVGVGVTLITQRSARMNKSVSELAECMIAFRTVGPRSMEAILDWLGEHVEKARQKEIAETLRSLPVGRALVISPGWLEYEGIAEIRRRNTFDSSATPKPGQTERAPGRAAKPDLAKYQERMAETIERARASDPQILRKRIAELERQLREKGTAADQEAIARAVERETERMAKAHLEAERKYMERIATLFERLEQIRALAEAADLMAPHVPRESSISISTREEREKLLAIIQPKREAPGIGGPHRFIASEPDPAEVFVPRGAPAHKEAVPRHKNATSAHKTGPPAHTNGSQPLAKGERAILTVIAQYPYGAAREQITILTGYKRSSRDTYIQRLRAAELVENLGDMLIPTQAGVKALGANFEPLPTGEDLRAYWLDRLPEGERRILEIVLAAYPKSVDRETISEATDYKRSSRDTYLQRLNARKLIVNVGRGEVCASEVFFE